MSHSILRNYLKLLCAAFLLFTVRADFTPSLPEADPISSPPLEVSGTVCDCQMFIQSWKTSHMIRLPISMQDSTLPILGGYDEMVSYFSYWEIPKSFFEGV